MAEVFIRDASGDRYAVDESELGAVLNDPIASFRLETPEEASEALLQEKYGGTGQQVVAGLEGAARGLTLGLSTPLERAFGVPAEDIAGREAANPTAALVGEGIGVAAPLIATMGAAAPAQAGARAAVRGAAELTAPALIARVGRAAEAAAGRALPAAESTLAQVARQGATLAAGQAVEGALYGVGNVIHEAALGDPHLTAQSALADIGTSAALAGGLGFLGGATSKGLGVATEKARIALDKASEKLRGAFPSTEAFAAAVENSYTSVNKALKEANRVLRPEETSHFALVEVNPSVAREAYAGVVSRASELATRMREAPELYPARFAKRLEDWATALVRDADGVARSPAKAFESIDRFKGQLDDLIKFDKMPADDAMEALSALKGLRAEVRNGLENEAIWGTAAARQAGFNEAQARFLTANRNLERMFTTRVSGVGGPVRKINPRALELLGKTADDAKGALKLQVFEEWQDAARKLIDQIHETATHAPSGVFDRAGVTKMVDATDRMFAGVQRRAAIEKTANMITGGLGLVGNLGVGSVLGGGPGAAVGAAVFLGAKAAKQLPRAAEVLERLQAGNGAVLKRIERAAAQITKGVRLGVGAARLVPVTAAEHKERADRVRELALAPEQLQESLERMVDGLHDHAPDTAQALQVTTTRAVTFLASKLPVASRQGPLGPALEASREQQVVFGRYYDAVERPVAVLDRVSDGTLTKEHMEALEAVHPALLAQMRASMLSAIAASKGTIPRQSRLAMSRLLGQPLDRTLLPPSMARFQAVYQQPGAPDGGLPSPPPASVPKDTKLTLGNRAMTALDSGAQRRADG